MYSYMTSDNMASRIMASVNAALQQSKPDTHRVRSIRTLSTVLISGQNCYLSSVRWLWHPQRSARVQPYLAPRRAWWSSTCILWDGYVPFQQGYASLNDKHKIISSPMHPWFQSSKKMICNLGNPASSIGTFGEPGFKRTIQDTCSKYVYFDQLQQSIYWNSRFY